MKPFFRKNIASFIFIATLTVLGGFIALILIGKQNEKEELGTDVGLIASFCLSASIYMTILKINKKVE